MKRETGTVRCDVCGCEFTQTRWWQAFCSRECRLTAHRAQVSLARRTSTDLVAAVATIRSLEAQVRELELALDGERRMRVNHSQGPAKAFRYDEEDQSQGWQEG